MNLPSPMSPDSVPTTPLADYSSEDGVYNQEAAPASPPPLLSRSKTQQWPMSWQSMVPRRWFAIRWQLSRSLFARPLPFLTDHFDLKMGDLILTLPVALILVGINALSANNHDVGGSGSVASIVMMITFALAVRNDFILLIITGLPFERALFYHKFFGCIAWIVAGLHLLAYLLNDDEGQEFDSVTVTSGYVMFGCLSALVVFAFFKIRRLFFEWFLRFHWIFFLAIVVAGVIHGSAIILVGFLPWVADVVFRQIIRPQGLLAGINSVPRDSQVSVTLVTKDIVRVQFPRDNDATGTSFEYEPGQYAFLCFPHVAKLEWHPFSIVSAPHEPMVTFFIKVTGDWTKKLAESTKHTPLSSVTVLVDGPYGATSIEMDHFSHAVMISGGIGVTPMLSIANDLFYNSVVTQTRVTPVRKAWFLWSVRDRETIEALMLDTGVVQHPVRSWLPHALLSPGNSNLQDRDAFFAQFFLTKGSQDLSHSVDQQLGHCLQYGQRPDIAQTLREVGQQAIRDNTAEDIRVAVLVCGPQALISEVIRQGILLTKELKTVTFDVNQETFDF